MINIDTFSNEVYEIDSPAFVPLYDDKGTKLNIILISKPFSTDKEYKMYMTNKHNNLFLGITSYMEFPHVPTNPLDNFKIENFTNAYNLEMYFELCEGWLHCFKNPCKYLPSDKPHVLISESDFINYNLIKPDTNIIKEYDFIYSCPKVNKDSGCNDWVSYNKNWELALKCLPILCEKYKLKGLLIGREGCEIPEGCKPFITTTGWVEYNEMLQLYKKCKFLFVPNIRDASPRVITEALALDLPCIMNKNILGGWKYINEHTGEFFNDETDIEDAIKILLNKNYHPRQYIIDNYGPINSGKRLRDFILDNFKDKLNIKDCEYIVIRNPLI
jgi:glycosyltransferase involved in cell wall biosynthesis